MQATKWVKRGERKLVYNLNSIIPCVVYKPHDRTVLYFHADDGSMLKVQMNREEFKELAKNMLNLLEDK